MVEAKNKRKKEENPYKEEKFPWSSFPISYPFIPSLHPNILFACSSLSLSPLEHSSSLNSFLNHHYYCHFKVTFKFTLEVNAFLWMNTSTLNACLRYVHVKHPCKVSWNSIIVQFSTQNTSWITQPFKMSWKNQWEYFSWLCLTKKSLFTTFCLSL
jgi:hypothetical protein